MENNQLEDLIDHTKDYVSTRVEIARLQVIDKTSRTGGVIASHIFFLVIVFSVFFFASTAAALYIGRVTGSYHYGFLAMGGFFAFTGILCYVNRDRWIIRPFSDSILRSMLKDPDHE